VSGFKKEELFNSLVEKALDFLKHAIEEFEDNPKYAIVHGCRPKPEFSVKYYL